MAPRCWTVSNLVVYATDPQGAASLSAPAALFSEDNTIMHAEGLAASAVGASDLLALMRPRQAAVLDPRNFVQKRDWHDNKARLDAGELLNTAKCEVLAINVSAIARQVFALGATCITMFRNRDTFSSGLETRSRRSPDSTGTFPSNTIQICT
ncbi:hypothetical protein EVG20_g2087 [Dentipellis fragilis]|uniref:Uncharacterized protein n=1 Tax=Dentipellis fragilis TaxID=205917 RepID=A0A4Y9ZAP5_9AGAM|nr:hypothetical protein EVG20_g2087 [Dentipellis fragilis]